MKPTGWLTHLRTPEEAPPWGQMSALVALAMVVACFVAGAFLILPLGMATGSLDAHWLALTIGAILTLAYLAFFFRNSTHRAALGKGFRELRGRQSIQYWLAWGFMVSFALDLLGQALIGRIWPPLELWPTFQARLNAELGILSLLLAALFMLVLQPIIEEVVLRGMLYPAMRARIAGESGVWVALISAALAHSILHNALYGSLGAGRDFSEIWLVILLPSISGFTFGMARAISQSTLAAVYCHAGFGVAALAKILLL